MNKRLAVNCLLSLQVLAAMLLTTSCLSLSSNSGPTSGSVSGPVSGSTPGPVLDSVSRLDKERESDRSLLQDLAIDFIPSNAYAPAPVTQSNDPNVKYKTLRQLPWDIDTDSDATNTGDSNNRTQDIFIANPSPAFRMLLARPKAQLGMVNKSSFDAVTLDDLKNAKLFSGGVRIGTDLEMGMGADNPQPTKTALEEAKERAGINRIFKMKEMFDTLQNTLPQKLAQMATVKYKVEMGPGAYLPLRTGSLLVILTSSGKCVKAQVIGWEPLKKNGEVLKTEDGKVALEKWDIKLQYVVFPQSLSPEEMRAVEAKEAERTAKLAASMKRREEESKRPKGVMAPINMGPTTIPIDRLYKEGLYVAWLKKPKGVAGVGGLNNFPSQVSAVDGKTLAFFLPDGSTDHQTIYHKDSHILLFLFETAASRTKSLTFYCLKVKPLFNITKINNAGKPYQVFSSFDLAGIQTHSVSCQDQTAVQKLLREIMKQSFPGSDSDVHDDAIVMQDFCDVVNKMTANAASR